MHINKIFQPYPNYINYNIFGKTKFSKFCKHFFEDGSVGNS